ncbi:MAG: metallophosphoesterase [Breznakibacter sp.]
MQISDAHLGSFQGDFDALQEVVRIINGHHPDLIVFTGDLVNNFHQEATGWEKIFRELKAPMGLYSILGNHDYGYYSRWDSDAERNDNFLKIVEANGRLGFTLLRNEHVLLRRNGESIALAGVEYWGTSGHFPNTGNLAQASEGIGDAGFKVLLSHDPDHWDAEVAGKTDYDLTLAGHTHGMQLGVDFKGFTWSPAKYKFKRWDGLYRQGNQFLFVNRGLGTLSMPIRVGMSPEITLIELSRGPVGTEPM